MKNLGFVISFICLLFVSCANNANEPSTETLNNLRFYLSVKDTLNISLDEMGYPIYPDIEYIDFVDDSKVRIKRQKEEIIEKVIALKKEDSEAISVLFADQETITIYKESNECVFFPKDRKETVYNTVKIDSIDSTPVSYEAIENYNESGMVRGKVKEVSSLTYNIRERFGENQYEIDEEEYYRYDSNGNLVELNEVNYILSDEKWTKYASYTYSDDNLLISSYQKTNNVLGIEEFNLKFEYDSLKKLLVEKKYSPSKTLLYKTEYQYNLNNSLKESNKYDNNGNLVSKIKYGYNYENELYEIIEYYSNGNMNNRRTYGKNCTLQTIENSNRIITVSYQDDIYVYDNEIRVVNFYITTTIYDKNGDMLAKEYFKTANDFLIGNKTREYCKYKLDENENWIERYTSNYFTFDQITKRKIEYY